MFLFALVFLACIDTATSIALKHVSGLLVVWYFVYDSSVRIFLKLILLEKGCSAFLDIPKGKPGPCVLLKLLSSKMPNRVNPNVNAFKATAE